MSKPVGRPGDWFATWDKESLPCVHQKCLKGRFYHDPFDGEPCPPARFQRYLAGIRAGRVLLTKTQAHPTKGHPQRKGYIALLEVANVEEVDGGIKFEVVGRPVNFR